MAAAAVKSIGGGLGRGLRELRIHLCQRSAGSQGVRSARGWAGTGPGVLLQGSETPPSWATGTRPPPSLRREFIEQHYVTLKKANPDFPILIRECSGIQPKLWARYEFGKEKSIPLNNLSADEVGKALESVVKSHA
ncbi:NADH dehydrogenase [ubiquinone] 1 alpha subcomplex subunit 2 isoform X1 [Cinclus cinclus]|uniref:NADH dehydrogenase [ubiquinone] 1 alpha subcomplex subunit 2 isoform X1 n=1 Tax=Cinclus cinclus TaxID=127875 RepID=UPI002E0DC04C